MPYETRKARKGYPWPFENLIGVFELDVPVGGKGLGQASLQLQAFGLAGGRVGHVLPEENDLGPFGEWEAASAVLQQGSFGRRRRSLTRDDIRGDLLTVVPVLERHGHCELDTGVPLQHVVNLQRRDVDPAADDQLLDPAGDEEERATLLVTDVEALVARPEPAPLKRCLVRVRPLEIALADRPTTDTDLPANEFLHFPAVPIQDRHLVVPDRHADRGEVVSREPAATLAGGEGGRPEAR